MEGKLLSFGRILRSPSYPMAAPPEAAPITHDQLTRLLLAAAAAADPDNPAPTSDAVDALEQLYRHVSPLGDDPFLRVAAYFADALAAAMTSSASASRCLPSPEQEFAAFTHLYRASPFFQFGHFTANQTIVEAFEAEEGRNGRKLHVIDFDVSYGFQWPSLLQSLSDKATPESPVSLHLTGFGRTAAELEETRLRLVSFAHGCANLAFAFTGLVRGSTANDLMIDEGATLVVNLAFYLRTLQSSAELRATLAAVRALSPSVTVVVERETGRPAGGFLGRFVENLSYFAAMFESLHDCLPAESAERVSIERDQLGKEMRGAVQGGNWEWRGRMASAGFEEAELSSRSVSQARLLLKMKGHASSMEHVGNGGFGIEEARDGNSIALCWRRRRLVSVSAWRLRPRAAAR
ncbi:protein MONOCULM 1-like [Curcuma longa]|uniref:protein MONOCULM 1-like n=1 Tax=Curcuma longa TaxID=136217 RepID=UPI003D9EFBE0